MEKTFIKKNKKISKKQKGFALLFAVLVSTLVLAVGTSIITIALKQITLSGSARDSQFAFYAANTGVECAIFWDFSGSDILGGSVFATSSDSISLTSSYLDCGSSSVEIGSSDVDNGRDVWGIAASNSAATTTFRVLLEDVPYCADIIVSKSVDGDDNIKTTIDSRGYNTCDDSDKRRIERGLRISY